MALTSVALLGLIGCADEADEPADGNPASGGNDEAPGASDDDAPAAAAADDSDDPEDICAEHDAWFAPTASHDIIERTCFPTPLSLEADGTGQTRCWIFNHRSCTTPACDPENYEELVACAAGELIPETCPNCATDGVIATAVSTSCSGTGRLFVGNCGLDCPPEFCSGALHPENQVTVRMNGERWTSTTVDFRGFPPNQIEARNAQGDRLTLSWAGNTTEGIHELSGLSGFSEGGVPGSFSSVVDGTIDVTSLDTERMVATFEMTTDSGGETLEFTEGEVAIEPY
jgi:hypothetical protein